MIDGELVEPPEDDVETGSSFTPVEEPNTEFIAIIVIHEHDQKAEVVQIVEVIIEKLLCDIVK